MIQHLICAHLIGDFLLQNHWMASRKASSSMVCLAHVAAYSLPFLVLVCVGFIPGWVLALILAQHWLQDRFGLHLVWMRHFGQTTPEQWPAGPLCVDQAMHVAFMWWLTLTSNL